MAVTNIINQNEEYIKGAIADGIDAEAVNSTLGDIVTKMEETGKSPEQVKEVVETIVEMKKDTDNVFDESYASAFVQENNAKIKSAINDGITPKEIARTLVTSTKNAKTRKSKKHLKFITNLISKMKVKEMKLRQEKENQMEKGMQKVLK